MNAHGATPLPLPDKRVDEAEDVLREPQRFGNLSNEELSAHPEALEGCSPRASKAPARAGTHVDIGPIESISVGQGRSFIIAGRTIAVFRQRDGCVFAIDNQCPHRGGPLAEGILGDGKVICPMHSWKIDLASGRCLGESASLRTYGVRILNGRVFVQCGTEE